MLLMRAPVQAVVDLTAPERRKGELGTAHPARTCNGL